MVKNCMDLNCIFRDYCGSCVHDDLCCDSYIPPREGKKGDSMNLTGIVYFKDGHKESILFYCDYEDNMIIEFHTTSGRYLYYAYLNTANKKANYIEHIFYKSVLAADDFGYIEERLVPCYDIERIEIFREEE